MASSTVVVDLTNYKDKVGAKLPEGIYKVVIDDADTDTSTAGNPMILLWYKVAEGPQQGSVIVDRLALTDKSMFRVVNVMRALGLPTPKKRLQVNIAKWVGKVLVVEVADEPPYNGRVKSGVREYHRYVAPKTVEVANEDNEELNELAGLSGDTDDNNESSALDVEKIPAATVEADLPDEVDLDALDL
jgi:hypothetical protein